jgi:hypothetical protein
MGAEEPKRTETWPLTAVVKRDDQRYENGVLIVATVDIVTSAVPEVAPLMTDTLIDDGSASSPVRNQRRQRGL